MSISVIHCLILEPLRNEFVTLSYRRVGVLMETNLSLFCSSSLGGGGRGSDPICTMSRYLPFLSFDGSPNLNNSVKPPKSWMLGGWWWANPLQTFPQGPLLTFHVYPDPELDNFLVHFLSIYDNLMSHHVPSPPDYDVVMTEQVQKSPNY